MMVNSNQLRGIQSESTLILMMEKEIEERKKQTELLKTLVVLSLNFIT